MKLLRVLARAGNIAYDLASLARRPHLQQLVRQNPRSFVLPPEQIEAQTAYRIGPTLQHIIKEVTGREPELAAVLEQITEGQAAGYFENYGEAIFINPHRIDDLLLQLEIPAEKKAFFLAEAKKHYLLREYVYSAQAAGHFSSRFRVLERGSYIEREYSILTRDGKQLKLTRIVNQDRVKTNDTRPSVLLFPGIACNSKFFDLTDGSSLALDLADQGRWVYLFDPRGLGKNKGDFDPLCFLDTLISNDAPAAVDFIRNRPSPKKPMVIIGHSMGGMIAEFMIVRQAYKLNQQIREIRKLTGQQQFRARGRDRAELAEFLDRAEKMINGRRAADRELKALIAEARSHLDVLNSVKGLITLGSPKIFDRNHHPIFPALLLLNIFLPLLREEQVPVDKGKWLLKLFPSLAITLRHLVASENFEKPNAFLVELVEKATDSFPLGVGLQLLKSVYSGRGIRRMDQERFNYPAHLDEIPVDLPIFHLIGTEDTLVPAFNLGVIDSRYANDRFPAMASFPRYSHANQGVYHLAPNLPLDLVPIGKEGSQVKGFVIQGVGHLDFFYGRTGEKVVRPLLDRLIEAIWQA